MGARQRRRERRQAEADAYLKDRWLRAMHAARQRRSGSSYPLANWGVTSTCGDPRCVLCNPHPTPPRPAISPEPSQTLMGEPLVGWRAWNITRRGDTMTVVDLAQLAKDRPFDWPDAVLELSLTSYSKGAVWGARGRIAAHEKPTPTNHAGLWAFKDRSQAEALGCPVYGEVHLWGVVVECSRGFRAEYAYPKRLFMAKDDARADVVREAYGVPVELVDFPPPPAETYTQSLYTQSLYSLINSYPF